MHGSCHDMCRMVCVAILVTASVITASTPPRQSSQSLAHAETPPAPANNDRLKDPASPEARKKATDEAARGRIREKSLCLAESESASGILVTLYDKFRQNHQDTPLQLYYKGGGTETGLQELLAGQAEAAILRRDLTKEEKDQLAKVFHDRQRQPAELVFSRVALVLVIRANNTTPGLMCEQVVDIINGRTTNWSQVGCENGRVLRIGTPYPTLGWKKYVIGDYRFKTGVRRILAEIPKVTSREQGRDKVEADRRPTLSSGGEHGNVYT